MNSLNIDIKNIISILQEKKITEYDVYKRFAQSIILGIFYGSQEC